MSQDARLSRVLHVLIHLSLRNRTMSSAEIAKMLSINPVVVRRMMAGLRDRGYLQTTRGSSGGWYMALELDEITVNDVYEALNEPNLLITGLAHDHPTCPVEASVNDMLNNVNAEAELLVLRRYRATTLADLAQDAMKNKGSILLDPKS